MQKYLTFLFIGISLFVKGQQLSGTITDINNNPLINVEVYIEDLQIGTSTNEQGYYQLNNLPSNLIKITAAYLGFGTQHKLITLQKNTSILNFILKESVFNMDEVIISTPFNKLQSENVMKVEKATLSQLQNKGIVTLSEGISSIPGVSTISTGIGIGKPVIRGLRGNRVLVYSQGIRLENQQFGDEHGLGVDESSIESMEVIKGPASLLYGSDALGGVLYFNPLKFAKINQLELAGSQTFYTNTEGTKTSISVKNSFNSWKFLTNGAYNSHSDYKIYNGKRVTNTRFNETTFNSALGFNNQLTSSTLRFSYNRSLIGIPEEIGMQSTSKSRMQPYQDLTTKMVSLQNSFYLNNSKIISVFGYTLNVRNEFEEHPDENNEIEEPAIGLNLNTFSYDLKWVLPKFNNLETIIGIQGMQQDNLNKGEEILIPNATINDNGIFATVMYSKGVNSLQGGIRFDTRNIETEKHLILHEDEELIFNSIHKSFHNISASAGFKTIVFNKIISRLNIASGFKAPNLAELTSNGIHHGSNRFEIGNSDLKQEQNYQSDISLEYKTDHIELVANGFYNYINKYIFINPTGVIKDEFELYSYSQENAKLYGGEFGIHIHPHPFDWLHLHSNFELVIGKQENGTNLPLIPANKLTNTLRTEFTNSGIIKNGFASVTLENTFKQTHISSFETPSSAYNIVNIGVGGSIKLNKLNFDLHVTLNNIFNTEYISHLSRLKSNSIENMGRNLIGSLKFSIL